MATQTQAARPARPVRPVPAGVGLGLAVGVSGLAFGAGRVGWPQAIGLDVVGPAAFLALIWPRIMAGRTERAVALGGAAIALGVSPVLPVGLPVILAALAALIGALAETGLPRPR